MNIEQKSTISMSDLPKQTDWLHKDKIDQFLLLCRPLDMKGIILLDPLSARIFNYCDGHHNIVEIGRITGTSKEKVTDVVSALLGAKFLQINGKMSDLAPELAPQLPSMDSWFHVTNNCNLACSYCYVHKTKGSMTWEVAKRALEALNETALLNGRQKTLIKLAGGEPLLKFDFLKQIVNYGKEYGEIRGVENRFHLITNGTMISDDVAEFIKVCNLSVSVSLDGVDGFNDRQRFYPNRRGSFVAVDRGIKMLLRHGVRPYVLATITSLSLPGLSEFTHYLLDNNIGSRFSLYRDLDQKVSPENIDPEMATEALNQCYDIFEKKLPERDLLNFHQLCDLKFSKKRKRNCGLGSNGIVIGHKGQVSICQALLDQPVGDIFVPNLLKTIREQSQYNAADNSVDDNPGCQGCVWRYICAGGCPLLTKAEYGNFKKSSPYCKVFQACIPRLIRIMGMQMVKKMQGNHNGEKGGENVWT